MEAHILILMIIMIITIIRETSHSSAQDDHTPSCYSSCGNIHNISFTFRLETDPPSYGISSRLLSRSSQGDPFVLYCKNNVTILNTTFDGYNVEAINYENYTIRLADSTARLRLHPSFFDIAVLVLFS